MPSPGYARHARGVYVEKCCRRHVPQHIITYMCCTINRAHTCCVRSDMLRARASSVVRNLARASSSGNALASSVPKAAAASGEKSGESGGRGGGGIVFPLLFFAGAGAGMYYAYDQELLPRELQEMLRSSAKRSPVATAQKPASRASPSTVSATAPTTPPTASAPAPAKTHVAADSETITSPEPAPYDPVAAAQVASSIAAAQDAALVLARQLVTPVANAEAAVAVTAAVPEPVPVPTLPPPSPWVRREALRQARERAAAWKVEALQAILRRGDGNGIGDAGADIDALSPAELRVRALKLATELHNRGRLEALHLMTSLEKNDAAWEHLVRLSRLLRRSVTPDVGTAFLPCSLSISHAIACALIAPFHLCPHPRRSLLFSAASLRRSSRLSRRRRRPRPSSRWRRRSPLRARPWSASSARS